MKLVLVSCWSGWWSISNNRLNCTLVISIICCAFTIWFFLNVVVTGCKLFLLFLEKSIANLNLMSFPAFCFMVSQITLQRNSLYFISSEFTNILFYLTKNVKWCVQVLRIKGGVTKEWAITKTKEDWRRNFDNRLGMVEMNKCLFRAQNNPTEFQVSIEIKELY